MCTVIAEVQYNSTIVRPQSANLAYSPANYNRDKIQQGMFLNFFDKK